MMIKRHDCMIKRHDDRGQIDTLFRLIQFSEAQFPQGIINKNLSILI